MRVLATFTILLACPLSTPAQLRFVQPSVDFGELRGGPSYAHRFEFVNESTQADRNHRLPRRLRLPATGTRQARLSSRRKGHARHERAHPRAARWPAHLGAPSAGIDSATSCSKRVSSSPLTVRNEVTVEPSIIAMTIESTLRQEVTIRDLRATPLKIVAVLASSPRCV